MSNEDYDKLLEQSKQFYGKNNTVSGYPLPVLKQFILPKAPPEAMPYNPDLGAEACGGKIIQGAIMGGVLGIGLGLFMGAMGDNSAFQIVNGREVPQPPLREQLRSAYKSTAAKAGGWARNFGVLTALFGGVECVLEKYRGKHDSLNPVLSGCIVGATVSASGGPTVIIYLTH